MVIIPRLLLALFLALVTNFPAGAAGNALPSWNDGPSRKVIVDFVAKVTQKNGPSYVPPAERIAVFDNDGTLWAEQPLYFQPAFALDRVKALAPQHAEWKEKEPRCSKAISKPRSRAVNRLFPRLSWPRTRA